MLNPSQTVEANLRGAAFATLVEDFNLGRDAALPLDEFPLAQIIETLDERVCPLCASVHGMILDRRSPEFAQWKAPSHINCRRVIAYIGKDEVNEDGSPVAPDFQRPPDEIIQKHGHYHVDSKKYSELRVPSRPEGRDFIALPQGKGKPARILWRDGLPLDALKATLRDFYELLQESGLDDAWLAQRYALLANHAASQISYSALEETIAKHAGDWALETDLATQEYVRVGLDITVSDESAVCAYQSRGRDMIGLYQDSLAFAPRGLSLDAVTCIYDPRAGEIQSILRSPNGAGLLRQQSSFRPIRGFE